MMTNYISFAALAACSIAFGRYNRLQTRQLTGPIRRNEIYRGRKIYDESDPEFWIKKVYIPTRHKRL